MENSLITNGEETSFHSRITTYLPSLQSISIEVNRIERYAFFVIICRDTKTPARATALVFIICSDIIIAKAYPPVMACRKLVLNVEFRANFTAEFAKM
jgi:hypothetical protein